MSIFFRGSDGDVPVTTSMLVTAAPFTVAMWIRPTDTSGEDRFFWALRNSAEFDLEQFSLGISNSETWRLQVVGDSEEESGLADFGSASLNQWHFVLGRFISSTNCRASVLEYDGTISHAQVTDGIVPSGINEECLGGLPVGGAGDQCLEGCIAEYWITNADIQPGGGQLQETLLRRLAHGGPFSVPHIAKDILEYRSFRGWTSQTRLITGGLADNYWGRAPRTWLTDSSFPPGGENPPLPYWYRRPGQRKRALLI